MIHELPPACAVYLLQGATLSALWLAFYLGSAVDVFQLPEKLSNTALKPSWMPRRLFLVLVSKQVYRPAAYSTIPLLLLAAVLERSRPVFVVRLLSAVAATLFQLGDSCRTTSHRDYLMIYICWALLVSDRVAQCMAYGLCVLYILGSGLSKLRIGGISWGKPETMRAVLETFSKKTPKQGGPILAFANRWVRQSNCLCGLCGSATLFFELCAPVAFLLPQPWRLPLVGGGMVLLHLAIGALQSGAIGAFFLPNVAAYVLGFHASVDLGLGTTNWCLAVLTCFAPLFLASFRATRLLEEDWPLTPFALYPYNARHLKLLHEAFVEGPTRLVACNGPCGVGQRVIPIEHRMDVPLMERRVEPLEGEVVCYDLWCRTLGFTTYQDEVLLELLREPKTLLVDSSLTRLVELMRTFLVESGRVVELSTGSSLTECRLVAVGPENRVERVIC